MTVTATYADADHTRVRFTMNGVTYSVPADWRGFYLDGIGGVVGFLADGGTIADYTAPAPTADMVNAERSRRIALPLTVTITGIGSFPIQMDQQSRDNMTGLTTLALVKQGQGDTGTMVTFRDANNADHDLIPAQVIQMGAQAAGRVDAVYKASWAIKDGDTIPADYADDSYWD